jgi:hypothetical protein
MAYEFRELTEAEEKELIDKGQRIVALTAKKGDFATERMASEGKRSNRIATLDAEIAKNNSAITAVRGVSVSAGLTDADTKTVVDLTQRNQSLTLEIIKIQAEKVAEDKSYNTQYANIDSTISALTDQIAKIREAKEVA